MGTHPPCYREIMMIGTEETVCSLGEVFQVWKGRPVKGKGCLIQCSDPKNFKYSFPLSTSLLHLTASNLGKVSWISVEHQETDGYQAK